MSPIKRLSLKRQRSLYAKMRRYLERADKLQGKLRRRDEKIKALLQEIDNLQRR